MGNLISRLVFVPPNSQSFYSDGDLCLITKHNSRIQVKILERKSDIYLIVSHGNAEDIGAVFTWAENTLLKHLNINIVMYEYTGYGSNEEDLKTTEQSVYNDIEAVYHYLIDQMGINPEMIILYGRSIGSGPSCFLAEKYKVGGLILNCGLMSVLRVIFKFRFTFPFDLFPNIERIKNIDCPVLIIHSIKDEIIPFYHGKELFKACKKPFEPLFLDCTTHNNIDKVNEDVFTHIEKFIHVVESKMY